MSGRWCREASVRFLKPRKKTGKAGSTLAYTGHSTRRAVSSRGAALPITCSGVLSRCCATAARSGSSADALGRSYPQERISIMKTVELTLPELALIAGTRGVIGAGIALLVADRVSTD